MTELPLKLVGAYGSTFQIRRLEELEVGRSVIPPDPVMAFVDALIEGYADEELRHVVERAGLGWDEARKHFGDESWCDEVEANRPALLEMGLWGVSSFRLRGPSGAPDFCTWGQDRLWRVEQEIRRRGGMPPLTRPRTRA